MLTVVRRQLNSTVSKHVRHYAVQSWLSPQRKPRRTADVAQQRIPFEEINREHQVAVLLSAHPDRDILRQLSPYVASSRHLERINRLGLAHAALEIFERPDLTDPAILDLTGPNDSSPLDAGVHLNRLISALVGFRYDTTKYDPALVTRLAFLAIDAGSDVSARYLLSPVRNPDGAPQEEFLLLPSDTEARVVFDRMYASEPLLASMYWAKRLQYQLNHLPESDETSRSRMVEDYRALLQNGCSDPDTSPTLRAWAAHTLGTAHAHGNILPFSAVQAQKWWEHSAALDSHNSSGAKSAFYLGCIYLGLPLPFRREGPPLAPRDTTRGIELLERSCHRYHIAAYELGRRHYIDWQAGDPERFPDHKEPRGVEPDDAKAARYFFRAARMGLKQARRKFAEMLVYGRAVPHVVEKHINRPKPPRALSMEDEDEENLDDPDAQKPDTDYFVFEARPRIDTLLYAESFIRPLQDPRTRRLPARAIQTAVARILDPAHVPKCSVLWDLPRLIKQAVMLGSEEAEKVRVDPPENVKWTRVEDAGLTGPYVPEHLRVAGGAVGGRRGRDMPEPSRQSAAESERTAESRRWYEDEPITNDRDSPAALFYESDRRGILAETAPLSPPSPTSPPEPTPERQPPESLPEHALLPGFRIRDELLKARREGGVKDRYTQLPRFILNVAHGREVDWDDGGLQTAVPDDEEVVGRSDASEPPSDAQGLQTPPENERQR